MKRLVALVLSLLIVFPAGVSSASASYYEDDAIIVDPTATTPLYANDVGPTINMAADVNESLPLDLAETSDASSIDIPANEETFDISKAIILTTELLHIATVDRATPATENGNQAPICEPRLGILNADSMKGDQYTTESEFIILTKYNGQNLCYDPEGDLLAINVFNDFPIGYVNFNYYEHPSGTWGGYRIKIFNAGVYPLQFYFTDSLGASSGIMETTFEVIRRGEFETISDSFSSATDTKTYPITVDYSVTDEYCIGTLRTGKSGFSVSVYDANGNLYGRDYADGPFYQQDISGKIDLPKPDGATGEYTFQVVVSSKESTYVDGDSSYRLAYGAKSQQRYFFEDVTDSMELPYYTKFRNRQQNNAEYINRTTTASEYGNYYRFTAKGTEVVTLASTYGYYRFKILHATEFFTMFDSDKSLDPPHHIDGDNTSYISTAELNFEAGQTYYVVVYDPNPTAMNSRGAYEIMVGERKVFPAVYQREIPSMPVTSGNQYSFNFTVTAPNGRAAYAEFISYSAKSLGWGTYYDALTPGAYNWRLSSSKYIKFGYENETNPLVKANGQWGLRFKPTSTGTYPGATLIVHYWYEL